MSSLSSINGNFKTRYGAFVDPLPDVHTMADLGPFVEQEYRPGLGYSFPVLSGIAHGQTADNTNTAFTLNPSIDMAVPTATLDGATIMMTVDVPYDTIYRSLNGAGNGSGGGAFMTTLDLEVKGMIMGANLYRELALVYGPGTSTAAAANIGVVDASVSGANLAAPQVVRLTVGSWIPGLWPLMAPNALVDIYQSDGTTVRETGVAVQAVPSTTQTRLQLYKSGSSATVAANDVIVPQGWRTKSCFGLEAIYNNGTTLFGINAALVNPWRCRTFSAGGQLTRAKILSYAAQISLNGVSDGGDLAVCATTFADLAEEASALRRYTDESSVRKQGASALLYETACGVIKVFTYQYAKQSQAMFIARDNFKRIGATDITMRPIGGAPDAFFTHINNKAGAQMKAYSNQAPVFEMPWRNFLITGIVNTTGPTSS